MLARSHRLRASFIDRRLAAALMLGTGLWATPAEAHIELLDPPARYTPDTQKDPPCGRADNPPGDGPVAVYQPGETITIQFDEFVDHGGHYRVALDPTGTDAFVLPTAFDDFYNSPEVILDEIPDMAGGVYSVDVTLPDVQCDPCTLQLIQVMNDGSWGPGDSDLYFQCADIVIEGASAETASGSESTGAGDSTGSASSGSASSGGVESEGSGGSSGAADGSGGTTNATTSDTTGPAESDEGGGCSCRVDAGSTAAFPWLLIGLVAWRRRRG